MSWSEVFEHWRRAEEERWRAIYAEAGFATWEEWRMAYLKSGRPEEREWCLVDAENIPDWYIGGFQGWKKYRPLGKEFVTFFEVAQSPILLDNPKVKELVDELHETTFIGMRCGGEIALIDGTHRAAAYAYRAAHGMELPPCKIYLAELPLEEKTLFDVFRRNIPSITR